MDAVVFHCSKLKRVVLKVVLYLVLYMFILRLKHNGDVAPKNKKNNNTKFLRTWDKCCTDVIGLCMGYVPGFRPSQYICCLPVCLFLSINTRIHFLTPYRPIFPVKVNTRIYA